MALQIKKNDLLTLKAQSLLQNGNALCKTEDGFVVFVAGAIPGEVFDAHVIKVTKSYAVAKIVNIIQPSLSRNEDGCPFSKSCGGCVFQHIDYQTECKYKEDAVNDALKRIGKLDISVERFYGAEEICAYRNKAVYPIGVDKDGKAVSGFYARSSHRIVQHDSCLISPDIFAKIRDYIINFINANVLSVYDELTGKGLMRSVFLRITRDEHICVVLVINSIFGKDDGFSQKLVQEITQEFPQIKTVCLNSNTESTNVILGDKYKTVYGDSYIYDELCGKKFRISPASFWQVNSSQAEVLYGIAKEFANLSPGEILADLYCGTGSVGVSIADEDTRLYGVEIVEDAARDAEFNARLNGIDGSFVALPAESALDDDFIKNLHPDVITVDPPRKGCVGAVKKIADLGAKRIVYISCDPATLARDLAEFEELGYKVQKVRAVDMFPRTGHVETCVLLSKLKSSKSVSIELDLDNLEITAAEAKATYGEIKEYILDKYGFKVSSLNIAQVKQECGIIERENFNKPSGKYRQPKCPEHKFNAIKETLEHFKMI